MRLNHVSLVMVTLLPALIKRKPDCKTGKHCPKQNLRYAAILVVADESKTELARGENDEIPELPQALRP